MEKEDARRAPGQVRDAILKVLDEAPAPLSVMEICDRVSAVAGPIPRSSIQSYLSLNTPRLFAREARGIYRSSTPSNLSLPLPRPPEEPLRPPFHFGRSTMFHAEALRWLDEQPARSLQAVVTDPPYGLHEYSPAQQKKLRERRGGVWRLPPSFDGHRRSPLPRFTTLTTDQLTELERFFHEWGRKLRPRLVPGAHVFVASSPLLSFIVAGALARAGLERRGEIIRLTTTMRGGDRPKAAHAEFPEVSVMPRSNWEPWLLFREPIEGRVQDNLRKWKTGALRRPSKDKPFGDVIPSLPPGARSDHSHRTRASSPRHSCARSCAPPCRSEKESSSTRSRAPDRRSPPRRRWATPASASRATPSTSTSPATQSRSSRATLPGRRTDLLAEPSSTASTNDEVRARSLTHVGFGRTARRDELLPVEPARPQLLDALPLQGSRPGSELSTRVPAEAHG